MYTCPAGSRRMVRRSPAIVGLCEEVPGVFFCKEFENMPMPIISGDMCGRDAWM